MLPEILGYQLVREQLFQIPLCQDEIKDILPVALLHQFVLPLYVGHLRSMRASCSGVTPVCLRGLVPSTSMSGGVSASSALA